MRCVYRVLSARRIVVKAASHQGAGVATGLKDKVLHKKLVLLIGLRDKDPQNTDITGRIAFEAEISRCISWPLHV